MWETGCSWWCSIKWNLCKYCTWSTPVVDQAVRSLLHLSGAFCISCPTFSFHSSRDILSSTKTTKYQGAATACSSSELLQGSRAGPRAEARDHNTPGSFLDASAAGPHHHHWTCSTCRHVPHTLLQAQTFYCSAKHQIMWTGSIIWSSALWTKEKCLQRNCI